jgi:hypothetical protein
MYHPRLDWYWPSVHNVHFLVDEINDNLIDKRSQLLSQLQPHLSITNHLHHMRVRTRRFTKVEPVQDAVNESVHAFRRRGIYPEDWGGEHVPSVAAGE